MRTAEYWQSRFEEVEKRCHNKGAVAYKDIEEQYRQAQRELESQISVWYQRFAKNNDITMQEARRLLTSGELAELKWDVNEYIKYGQQNAIDGKWMKQLENASARAHISRLEALKLQLQQQMEVAFGNQLDSVDSAMRAVYSMGYMHTAFEIQKGFGVGHNFAALNQMLIDRILNRPWAPDGKNFSDRIWNNKQKLINELNTTLTQGIILGKDPQKIINEMSKRLNVSKTNAGRLVMTESAAFASRAQEDCFKELGVEEYEIVATLDSHTSEICQDMDGKVFKMSERQIGINAPPFHVYCRSTTVPHFDDWQELGIDLERAARDENGGTYYVPDEMTYKEWEKNIKTGNWVNNHQEHSKGKFDKPVAVKLGEYDVEKINKQHSFSMGAENVNNLKDAVVYELQDGTRFVFPKEYDEKLQSMTPEKAVDLWYKLPEIVRKQAQKTIEFVDYYNPQDTYWQKVYKNFSHSYATGGDVITFYRYELPHDDLLVIRTYCHEAGHFIDKNRGKNGMDYSQNSDWTKAMNNDMLYSKRMSPTAYGENSNAEDFAESVAEFLWNPILFESDFPNRAALLKTILK